MQLNDHHRYISIDDLVNIITGNVNTSPDFIEYAYRRISIYTKLNTYNTYKYAIDKLVAFNKSKTLPFTDITKHYLNTFISNLQQHSISNTTISIYIRSLKSLYNDAIDEFNRDGQDDVIRHNPFLKLKIPRSEPSHRALSVEGLRYIANYRSSNFRTQMAVDMFMLSFMCGGLNTIDLFNMPVQASRIEIKRTKTENDISIHITPEMRRIFDVYAGKTHMLRFCETRERTNTTAHTRYYNEYSNVQAWGRAINDELQTIAKTEIEQNNNIMPENITMYYARHSFATIAMQIGISADHIALCLAHSQGEQNKVTWGYIEKRNSVVDDAIRKVIDFIYYS